MCCNDTDIVWKTRQLVNYLRASSAVFGRSAERLPRKFLRFCASTKNLRVVRADSYGLHGRFAACTHSQEETILDPQVHSTFGSQSFPQSCRASAFSYSRWKLPLSTGYSRTAASSRRFARRQKMFCFKVREKNGKKIRVPRASRAFLDVFPLPEHKEPCENVTRATAVIIAIVSVLTVHRTFYYCVM